MALYIYAAVSIGACRHSTPYWVPIRVSCYLWGFLSFPKNDSFPFFMSLPMYESNPVLPMQCYPKISYLPESSVPLKFDFNPSPSLLLRSIPQIRWIGSVWRRIKYVWVEMSWGQNSPMSQFGGGGGAEGWKTKIYPFFSQSIKNQKLYNISKNQLPKSIRRGDMEFPPFLTS